MDAEHHPYQGPKDGPPVPIWVKGMIAMGLLAFAIQLPAFKKSLGDAIIKYKASVFDESGRYTEAVNLYADLRSRHPTDSKLIVALGTAEYHAGLYFSALETFRLLNGAKMLKSEIEKVKSIESDIKLKINLNYLQVR